MIYPEKQEYLQKADEYDVIPVYKEILADTDTPVSVLQRFSDCDNAFLLESMEGGETWGRYSFVGVNPSMLLESDHSQGKNGEIEALREVYKDIKVAEIDELPRFFGGAVGFLGYESMCEFERMPKPEPSEHVLARSRFLKADCVIVFDNLKHTVKIVVSTRPVDGNSEEAYAEAVKKIEETEKILSAPVPQSKQCDDAAIEFESNMTREQFVDIVKKAKEYIYDGDIIQVVLSQRFSISSGVDPVCLYRALRHLNPSPYTFFLKIGDQTLVGSSPEVMVRLTGRKVELRPIAGTRPRGKTENEDEELARELLADEKEKAEHVMLVDLGRNDIGRIAESGTVNVTEYMVIEKYSHVMHMVSHVEGTLKDEYDAYDVVKATFPAGTLTGAPKIRAMEIIHELEPGPRGVYGGAVGYFGYGGNMDLAITIRTLDIREGVTCVQAGAGIVFDSDPEKEFEETCHKAAGMKKAVESAVNKLEL